MVKNDSIWLKQGHRMGLKKVFRGRVKVFLGFTGHNWPGSIEQPSLSFLVWSHEGSTFNKSHIFAKIPVLENLTYMWLYLDFSQIMNNCTHRGECERVWNVHKHPTAATNLSIIRQLVRNLLAKDKKLKGSVRTKMMKCAWNVKDREHILNQLFASLWIFMRMPYWCNRSSNYDRHLRQPDTVMRFVDPK